MPDQVRQDERTESMDRLQLFGLSPFMKSFDVQLMEFRRQERLKGVGPLLFLDLRKKIGKSADENHVRGLNITELSRDLLPVDHPDIIFEVFFENPFNVLRILHLSETDGREIGAEKLGSALDI